MLLALLRASVVALLVCAPPFAQAGVVITGTRVVYPMEDREVNVRLRNVDEKPVLVQSWIDDGSVNESPGRLDVPFVISPPMSRVEPQRGQTLRIIYTGGDQPQDRETVFYLNVLEVPPKPDKATVEKNFMQLAIRTRLKIFLRPQGLSMPVEDAAKALSWEAGSQGALRVHNPTPYYLSFNRVVASAGGVRSAYAQGMVAPFASAELPRSPEKVEGGEPLASGHVHFGIINDYGAEVSNQAELRAKP